FECYNERMESVQKLSDRDVLGWLRQEISLERRSTAKIVALIAEVDRRKLYREQACSSPFTYCVERLHLSENEAYKRIQVARLSLRCPAVLDYLEQGKIHLTGLMLLDSVLNAENWQTVLERAVHKTKRQIEELRAELNPRPDVPQTV